MRRYVKSSDRLRHQIETMPFGKFLFIYLLGKNVDYFTYKRILDIAIANNEDNDDGGPDIKEDNVRGGSRLNRQER
jgi:hypothetical protein